MNFIYLRKFIHHREFAEDFGKRFRVARTRRRFAVVFRKLQRVRKQKRIQPGGRACPSISRGNSSETFFFLSQMKLCKEMFVVEGGTGDALAEIRDGFRDGSHALLVFGRKKKRTQERTVDAIAKGKPRFAHALEQFFRQRGHTQKRGFQNSVPLLCGGRRKNRRCCSAGHFITIPARTPRPGRPLTAVRRRRSLALP